MSAFGEVSTLSFRLWRRHLYVFFRLWKSDAVPVFAEPFVILTVSGIGLGQLIDDVDGRSYLHFIGPGILGAYVMFAPTFENSWGSYIRMAVRRIYDAIIATPLSIEDVITGEILWGITRALIMGTLILVILAVIGAVESLVGAACAAVHAAPGVPIRLDGDDLYRAGSLGELVQFLLLALRLPDVLLRGRLLPHERSSRRRSRGSRGCCR